MYSNNGCHVCDGDTQYQDQPGQSSCKTVSNCSATFYQSQPPTASSNRQCAPCTTSCTGATYLTGTCGGPNTTYCTSCSQHCSSCTNATYCSVCADYQYYRSIDSSQCLTDCPPGQFGVVGDFDLYCTYCDPSCKTCINSDNLSCTSCGNTTFYDESQASTIGIRTCTHACPAGYYGNTTTRTCDHITQCSTPSQYMIAEPTSTSNRLCGAVTGCDPGQYATALPTATSNRVCQDCPAGTTDLDSNYSTACVVSSAVKTAEIMLNKSTVYLYLYLYISLHRTCSLFLCAVPFRLALLDRMCRQRALVRARSLIVQVATLT